MKCENEFLKDLKTHPGSWRMKGISCCNKKWSHVCVALRGTQEMRENVWCARQGVGRKTGVSILDWDHVFVCLLKSIPFFILLCILSFLMNSFILMYAWVHLLLYQCSFPTPPPPPPFLCFYWTLIMLSEMYWVFWARRDPCFRGLSHCGKPWMMPVSPHLCEELLDAQSHWEVQ